MEKLARPPRLAMLNEVDGIEMGVLETGETCLTGRGLSRLCGIAASTLVEHSQNWRAGKRAGRLAKMLLDGGYDAPTMHFAADGSSFYYSETVCMKVLEYYAFEAQGSYDQALAAFRKLATAGLRLFVWHALGYDPSNAVPLQWREFHDRQLLASAPVGYFSVFKEIADFVISAIRIGMPFNAATIPDISVGQCWARYWKENGFDAVYGPRRQYEHNFPSYFPQALSNPQDIAVYPVAALGEFRTWLQREYIPEKFPAYLGSKVAKGALPPSTAELLLANLKAPELPDGN